MRRSLKTRAGLATGAVCLALGLVSSNALADARTEARGHFKKGMSAIAAGRYEVGIDELKRAYETLPHPNVLFNIARAYVEMGDIENAIAYYKQYAAENPPDKEEVASILGQLQARLDRQRASLAAAQQAGPATPAPAAAPSTAAAPPTPSLPTGTPPTEPGQATTVSPESPTSGTPITPGVPGGPGPVGETERIVTGDERTEAVYEEAVVTASRGAATSPLESPNSTTIISEQDIRLSGITKLPELLRRVAGMEVMATTSSQTELAIRGFNQRIANKVVVLVDGRSTYIDWFGGNIWAGQTVNVDDIERIEVLRGPASALYGPDAFSGVVNIITKAPGTGRNGFRVGIGDDLSSYGTVRATGRDGDFAYRVSANYTRHGRWSYQHRLDRSDINFESSQRRDSEETSRIDIRTTKRLGKDIVLGVGGGYAQGFTELFGIGVLQNWSLQDGRYGDVTAYLNTPKLNTRVFYNFGRIGRLGAAFDYLAQDLYTSRWANNTLDAESTYADKFETGPLRHSVNVGANYRLRNATTAVSGFAITEHHYGVYAQDKVDLGRAASLVLSGRVDRVPYTGRFEASPRAALLLHPNAKSTIRATFSTAFRKPTFAEGYTKLAVQGPQGSVSSNTYSRTFSTLGTEHILTAELGYLNQMSELFDLEVNAYFNRVTDLLTLGQPVFYTPSDRQAGSTELDPVTGRFPVQTTGFVNQCVDYNVAGGEVGGRFYPVQGLDFFANYTSTNTTAIVQPGCTVPADRRTSPHKLNAGVQVRSKLGIDGELVFHYVSDQRWVERVLDVQAGGLIFRQTNLPAYSMLNARLGYRFAANKAEVYGTAFNLLNKVHQEHPFGHFVGRRFMAFFQYQF